ncbi:centromere protein O [Sphaeramia orbicularis]|uniref:Centromere protein O n=1 Tax=Sphaeramia orbicularis TaxID=375764 RepID=A0A673BJK8_9TELE|nr:centromere protein O [Sphaeramia orbicularis]
MEKVTATGVLNHLSLMEAQTRSSKDHRQQQQQSRVEELKAKVEELKRHRDQLKKEVEVYESVRTLRASMDSKSVHEEDERMDGDSENAEILWLMAKHCQVTDLLHAHRLIGGFEIIQTKQGKGLCVSVATSYEGVYLDRYSLEFDTKPTFRITRHNIPPFIPLNKLTEQSNMTETELKAFLHILSQHLNAYAGRKQQLQLVKEHHQSVEVMESNALCSLLVLLFTVPKKRTPVLCTMEYLDHIRCLPTRVYCQSEDTELPECPQWKSNCLLLMENPVHKALSTMKTMGHIV